MVLSPRGTHTRACAHDGNSLAAEGLEVGFAREPVQRVFVFRASQHEGIRVIGLLDQGAHRFRFVVGDIGIVKRHRRQVSQREADIVGKTFLRVTQKSRIARSPAQAPRDAQNPNINDSSFGKDSGKSPFCL